jgi:hypothetical protein
MLFSMQYVHPPYGFMFADIGEIDLGCFEVLMHEDYLEHDFEW